MELTQWDLLSLELALLAKLSSIGIPLVTKSCDYCQMATTGILSDGRRCCVKPSCINMLMDGK